MSDLVHEVVGWLATSLSLLGIFLNAKKIIACWGVWLISDVAWIIYFLNPVDPQSLVLWIVFIGFNIYGWVQWKNK